MICRIGERANRGGELPESNPNNTRRPNDATQDDEGTSEGGRLGAMKRKFSWFGKLDDLNEREADGTLKVLKEYAGPLKDGEFILAPDAPVPKEFVTTEMVEHWKELYETNGGLYYDHEDLALGSLNPEEYMLVPANWETTICPIENIGFGLNVFKVDILTISAVYALAKEQAVGLKFSDEDQVKWAVLRMEAYKSGWFDRQKFTMYKAAPDNAVTTMLGDRERIRKYVKMAYGLCAFVPFMTEYHFRAFSSGYSRENSAEYIAKATRFASSASMSEYLSIIDADTLYGKAFSWIGVRRPMLVLRNERARAILPSPFRIRAFAAPSGQAIITSSLAVIESIKSAGWWDHIKERGNWDDTLLVAVGDEIARDPWRYHQLSTVYGLPVLPDDERARVERAQRLGMIYAPVLHAYVTVRMAGTPFSKIKVLEKHAMANKYLYILATSLFRTLSRTKAKNVDQVFSSQAFQIGPAEVVQTTHPANTTGN